MSPGLRSSIFSSLYSRVSVDEDGVSLLLGLALGLFVAFFFCLSTACGFVCLSLAFRAAAREDEGEDEDVDEGVLTAPRVVCEYEDYSRTLLITYIHSLKSKYILSLKTNLQK